MNFSKGIQKSLGPGILLAGASIGGSHLMSSTTAGARYGFSLLFLILITNLIKYPFLLVGTRFTSSTGKSLLEGFKARNKLGPLFLIVSLITYFYNCCCKFCIRSPSLIFPYSQTFRLWIYLFPFSLCLE